MTDEEKAQRIVCFHCNQQYCKGLQTIKSCPKNKEVNSLLEMARWKDEQLGWHDAKKEQPPMDEEVIVLTNILNGKELSTPRRIRNHDSSIIH